MKINKNFKRITAVLVAMVFILSMMLCVYAAPADNSSVNGTKAVTTIKLNVRTGAGTSFKVIDALKKGTEVTLESKHNSWYKIKTANGKIGYISSKYIKMVAVAATPATPATPAVPAIDLSKIEKTMILATTTSTRDTGLLDVLVPAFDKKYGVTTKVVSVGSGEAIEMGKQGNADVLLVHSRKAEDEFVASGFGINRKDVMYNFFFVVGPKDDPAGVAATANAQEAFAKIAEKQSAFISRGDKSGTNTKELAIWAKYKIVPNGQTWYKESGQGMGDTLMMANELNGYTLVDSGTWFAFADKVNMKIVLQGDPILFNPYGVIAVNPAKYPTIHYNAATAFENFITSAEGQKIIAEYKKGGQQLFKPDAK